MGKASGIKPKHTAYHLVQIDGQWSYVGNKQKKVWLLYAICKDSGGESWRQTGAKGTKRA